MHATLNLESFYILSDPPIRAEDFYELQWVKIVCVTVATVHYDILILLSLHVQRQSLSGQFVEMPTRKREVDDIIRVNLIDNLVEELIRKFQQ